MGQIAISEASSLCSSTQGKLPLPTNQKENDDYLNAFRTMLKEMEELNEYVVLDANDFKSEGNFVSSTGKPIEWSNWREGEPNNQGGEHYVGMYVTYRVQHVSEIALSGKWNDIPDWFVLDIFCEFDL